MDEQTKKEIDRIIRDDAKQHEIRKFLDGKLDEIVEEVLKG